MTDFFCHLEEMLFPSPEPSQANSFPRGNLPFSGLVLAGKVIELPKGTVLTA